MQKVLTSTSSLNLLSLSLNLIMLYDCTTRKVQGPWTSTSIAEIQFSTKKYMKRRNEGYSVKSVELIVKMHN